MIASLISLGDLWIVIEDRVYDVSTFWEHPGGMQELTNHAGADATKAFKLKNHSDSAKKEMKS